MLRAVVFVVVGGVAWNVVVVLWCVWCVVCCVVSRGVLNVHSETCSMHTPLLSPQHIKTRTHTTTHTTQPRETALMARGGGIQPGQGGAEGTDERCDVRDLVGPEKKSENAKVAATM